MALQGFDEDSVQDLIARHFTPSKEITSIERLKGREPELLKIKRALPSAGRHVFIYGDRGVGKTSLAVTAANLHNASGDTPIYVLCSEHMTFFDVIKAIANSVIPLERRIEDQKRTGQLGLNIGAGVGATIGGSISESIESPEPRNINDALDIIRFVCSKRSGQSVIVIDEFDRIRDPIQKSHFAEFIKNIPTLDEAVKLIFCGIGQNIDEILGAHPSAGRYFEPIHVEKLTHDHLYEIIEEAAAEAKVTLPNLMLRRIGIVSDQFPHFVHLIGDCLFWALFDDPNIVNAASQSHYNTALTGALQKTERDLAHAYEKATQKSANMADYEQVLWAMADKSDTRRQVKDIHSASYLPLKVRMDDGEPLSRKKLNERLHSLRKPQHGGVILNHKAGWFSFRENVFRGYVRLVAEQRGIELRLDIAE